MSDEDARTDDLVEDAVEEAPVAFGQEDEADLHADPEENIPEILEEAVRDWRIAESLKQLRKQINALAPNRSKKSDGAIGDAAHATRASDHNPWVIDGAKGVVTAVDVTHDAAGGCDAGKLAEALRGAKDARIKYIIWNRRIANSAAKGGAAAWAWRPYTGKNPHNHHVHISVQPDKAKYDSVAKWAIEGAFGG